MLAHRHTCGHTDHGLHRHRVALVYGSVNTPAVAQLVVSMWTKREDGARLVPS